jgi:opacity protein-like surface antigen
MPSRLTLAFALIASMVFAGTAAAGDYGRSGWYLGAGGGVGWDFFDKAIEDAINKKCGFDCIDLNNGGTFNFRGGQRVNSWFAWEAMYEGVYGVSAKTAQTIICDECDPPFDGVSIPKGAKVSDFDLHNFLVNVKFIAPIKRFQPYFIFGLGAQYHTATLLPDIAGDLFETSRTDFVIRPGVGLDLYITESWLFVTEIGIPVSFRSYKNIPSSTTDNVSLTLSFGVTYRF